MLQFVSAQGVLRDGGVMWTPAAIGATGLYQVFRDYTSILVQIYDNVAHVNGWIDLYKLPYVLRQSPQSISAYLSTGVALSYLTDDPDWEAGFDSVKFYFANAFGYQARGINNNFPDDEPLLSDQIIDALLHNPAIKDTSVYSRLYRNCLFTCNGFIHKAGTGPNGITLYEAGRTAYKSQDNRFGILDFEDLGGITMRALTDADFIYPTAEKVLDQVVYIDLPQGQTLESQSVFMVCAGRLYYDDSPLTVVSSTRLKIDLRKLNLLDLYYDTHNDMNLSTCPLTPDPNIDDQFVVAEFGTDKVIRWFLTFINTFLVFVPRSGITVTYQRLNTTDQCGIYRLAAETDPQLPVTINRKRIGEYNVHEYDGFFTFTVPYYWLQRKMWWTTTYKDQIGVNYAIVRDQRESNVPEVDASAYLLRIAAPHLPE